VPHRLKASLDPVHTHCKGVGQIEAFGMLRQNRRKHARDNVFKFSLIVTSPKPTYRDLSPR
jgi:hypothetical protein